MEYPLFPLPLFLLPGGISKLRIFEPRYLRLVREACVDDKGFILAMTEEDRICNYGTHVTITNFETLEDNLLGISVHAKSRVKLSQLTQQPDGLWVGEVTFIPAWQDPPADAGMFGMALALLFEQYPLHAAQYGTNCAFHDLNWVCLRWLEVLPLAVNQRQWFLAQPDLTEAKHFLSVVLLPTPHQPHAGKRLQ